MGTAAPARILHHVLELFKAGPRTPVQAIEQLTAGPPAVEEVLLDLFDSPPVREESWAALWTLVVLGERRSMRALPALFAAAGSGNNIVTEGVEFALLRLGERAVGPVLDHLNAHPDAPGRIHLLALLAEHPNTRAVNALLRAFCPEARDFADVGWLLAQTRDPRATAALERAVQEYATYIPDIREPLEAYLKKVDLTNPLNTDWRVCWSWDAAADEPPAEDPDDEIK